MLAKVEAPTSAVELAARYRAAHMRLWGPPSVPQLRLIPAIPPPDKPATAVPPPRWIDDDTYSRLLVIWSGTTIPRWRPAGRNVCEIVARHFKISHAELIGGSRRQIIILPRFIAMYICVKALGYSCPETGRVIGGRDHSTVVHAVRKLSARIASNVELAAEVSALIEACGGFR